MLEPATGVVTPADVPDGLPNTPPSIAPPQQEGRPLAVFVLGCGNGGLVRALRAGGKGPDAAGPVIVVEPDRSRMLASLLAHEWRDLLEDPRVRFAVGAPLPRRIAEAVDDAADPLLEHHLGVAVADGEPGEHASRVREMFLTAANHARNTFDAEATAQAKARTGTHLPDGRWKILSVVSERTTALKSLARSTMAAASRHGHDTRVILTDHLADPFLGSNHLRQVLEAEPDVCVSFLRPGAMFAPWRTDYPSLVLVSSHPRLLNISEFPWSDRELVVVTDPEFAPAYREFGVEPVVRPLATDLPDPSALEAVNAPPCDVCVVGNLPGVDDMIPNLDADRRTRLQHQAELWARDPGLDPRELLAEAGVEDDEDGTVFRALAYEATARRRALAAITLAEAGFDVRIHGGPEWARHIEGTAAEEAWHGPIDPELDMPAAFRAATVSINVNSFATPNMLNMRSFDVPAAGGVLISDDRPALHDAFEPGTEVLAFQRLEELPELVAGVREDHQRREAIARAGRARVEREHSWDAWWRWAEETLRNRFGS